MSSLGKKVIFVKKKKNQYFLAKLLRTEKRLHCCKSSPFYPKYQKRLGCPENSAGLHKIFPKRGYNTNSHKTKNKKAKLKKWKIYFNETAKGILFKSSCGKFSQVHESSLPLFIVPIIVQQTWNPIKLTRNQVISPIKNDANQAPKVKFLLKDILLTKELLPILGNTLVGSKGYYPVDWLVHC